MRRATIGRASAAVFIVLLLLPPLRVGAIPPADLFESTWARTDKPVADLIVSRTWMWGPEAYTWALSEDYSEAPGGQRTVQYYDKSRMEDNNWRNTTPPWNVTNGLLVVEMMSGQMQVGDNDFEARQAAQVNVGGDADDPTGPTYATMAMVRNAPPLPEGQVINWRIDRNGNVTNAPAHIASLGVTAQAYVPETDHRVASVFWEFMTSSGVVWQNDQLTSDDLFLNPYYATGLPVTEGYWANIKVAGTYKWVMLQCFERRCLTYTPENPPGWQVEAANVGQHYHTWRYEQQQPPPPPPPPAEETTWVVTAPSGPFVTKTSQTWEQIPDLQTTIDVVADTDIAITLSAEAGTDGGRLFVRTVVDGQPTKPAAVLLTGTALSGVRSFTFGEKVTAGGHRVEAQWWVDGGYTASLGDRTLSIAASPSNPENGKLVWNSVTGGAIQTTNDSWTTISGMRTEIPVVHGGDLAITLSAEAYTNADVGRMWVRAVVDGQPTEAVKLTMGEPGLSVRTRTHTFTFAFEGVPSGAPDIHMEWRVPLGYTATMGSRTLTVMATPVTEVAGVLSVASVADPFEIGTDSTTWVPMPGMNTRIGTPEGSDLAITLSLELETTSADGRMFVRALVDGQPTAPSDVMFASHSNAQGARSFTFSVTGVSEGTHSVVIQWLADDAGTAVWAGDRTLMVTGWPVYSSPPGT